MDYVAGYLASAGCLLVGSKILAELFDALHKAMCFMGC